MAVAAAESILQLEHETVSQVISGIIVVEPRDQPARIDASDKCVHRALGIKRGDNDFEVSPDGRFAAASYNDSGDLPKRDSSSPWTNWRHSFLNPFSFRR